jgi:tRNA modification GTPase
MKIAIFVYIMFCLLSSRISSFKISRPRRFLTSLSSRTNPLTDTIYALSTGFTKSGVAVVRLSGPSSEYCYRQLIKSELYSVALVPRVATLRSLYCPFTQDMIDKALVLFFPGPKSFTGEDVIEFHLHGSRAVIASLFATFEKMNEILKDGSSVRPAEAGEFTRRAFDNGKMDLTEVEGLADLLAAETSEQRKQALRQLEGHLLKVYENWRSLIIFCFVFPNRSSREILLKCLAHTEAVIDFGDDDREDDINDTVMLPIFPQIKNMLAEINKYLADGRKGEIIRDGLQVALIGSPNAG